jgi:DNA (cytosine-5)-methyltransferase 1
MKRLRFIDLFAGIGGMRLGFEQSGFECVFSSEWDRFAAQTYEANFGDIPAGDIRSIRGSEIPDFDLLAAGFPCQPFSISGVSKKNALGRPHGFLDETQGTLFFEIARILKERRPRAFLLENVKNLASHDQGRTFRIIVERLEGLGYHIRYRILNANILLPQNRERIFLVGFTSESDANRFCFPDPEGIRPQAAGIRPIPSLGKITGAEFRAISKISSILDRRVDDRYTLSDKLWRYLQSYKEKHSLAGNGFGFGLVHPDGQARTLSARYYKDGSEILIPQRPSAKNPNGNPRRLTPRECARLMGFPEDFKIVVSDTQSYRQFGNSVAVPLVSLIAGCMSDAIRGFPSDAEFAKSAFGKPDLSGGRMTAIRRAGTKQGGFRRAI